MIASLRSRLNTVNAFQFFQLFRYGAALLISILLAKSYLEASEIAHYERLLYIGTAVSFFWVNAFLQSLLPIHPQLSKKEQGAFLFNVFLFFCAISLLIFSVLWLGQDWIIPALTGRQDVPYFNYFIWFLLFNLPTGLIEYTYLLQKRPERIVIFGLLSFGLYTLAVALPVLLEKPLEWSIQLMILVALFRFLWLLGLLFSSSKVQWQPKLLEPYLLLAWPLVGYAFVAGFAQLFDHWLVGWYFEEDRLFAIFRYGARELPIAMALVSGLSSALVPAISSDLTSGLIQIKEKSRRIFHWLFPLSILLMLTSKIFFPLLLNDEFAESALVFNVYLLLLCSRVLLPSTIMLGLKQTRVILLISIAEVLINVLLSLWLVQGYGLEGIAMATVVAFMFEKLTLGGYLYWKFGIQPQEYVDFWWYGIYSFGLMAAFVWTIL